MSQWEGEKSFRGLVDWKGGGEGDGVLCSELHMIQVWWIGRVVVKEMECCVQNCT